MPIQLTIYPTDELEKWNDWDAELIKNVDFKEKDKIRLDNWLEIMAWKLLSSDKILMIRNHTKQESHTILSLLITK